MGLATVGIDNITTDIEKSWQEGGSLIEANYNTQLGCNGCRRSRSGDFCYCCSWNNTCSHSCSACSRAAIRFGPSESLFEEHDMY